MSIYSHAVALVVYPLALLDIAIRMNESTVAVELAVPPESKVDTAVFPDLDAFAPFEVSVISGDFSDVDAAVLF